VGVLFVVGAGALFPVRGPPRLDLDIEPKATAQEVPVSGFAH
jgi:hypothetical protein